MAIAIALIFQDHFGYKGKFEERELIIMRILKARSGGYGFLGIEFLDNLSRKEIAEKLRIAIEQEISELAAITDPKFVKEIEHEGKKVLVYHVRFIGRPNKDLNKYIIVTDWLPYVLTHLATELVKMLPEEEDKKQYDDNIHIAVY